MPLSLFLLASEVLGTKKLFPSNFLSTGDLFPGKNYPPTMAVTSFMELLTVLLFLLSAGKF